MQGNLWILSAVFVPIILGAVMPALKFLKERKAKLIYVCIALAASTLCTIMAVLSSNVGSDSFYMFSFTERVRIEFKIDNMSRIFSILTVIIWNLVGMFSFSYMKHENHETRFFTFYIMLAGVLYGIDFSSNIITFYMFYELMTLTSLVLVLHTQTHESIMAGRKYVFYSIAGAFMALLAIFFINASALTLDFTAGGVLDPLLADNNKSILLAVTFLAIIGFGCKAGMFPMHSWLPSAHPLAPSPASAILSGIITKAGVLALIRVVFYIVGADFIRGTWVQYAWLILSLVTVFMGSMLAYKEKVLKKRLAYSTVSQVSYILFGLALLNETGMLGALLHVVVHSVAKNCLFLAAGAIIFKTGFKNVNELYGIGKRMPVTIWCFTLAGLTLVGIPPAGGFLSKWYLATGALSADVGVFTWLGPIVLIISALLTAGYILPVTINGFLPGKNEYIKEKCEADAFMLIPMCILAACAVLIGIFPNALSSFINTTIGILF